MPKRWRHPIFYILLVLLIQFVFPLFFLVSKLVCTNFNKVFYKTIRLLLSLFVFLIHVNTKLSSPRGTLFGRRVLLLMSYFPRLMLLVKMLFYIVQNSAILIEIRGFLKTPNMIVAFSLFFLVSLEQFQRRYNCL